MSSSTAIRLDLHAQRHKLPRLRPRQGFQNDTMRWALHDSLTRWTTSCLVIKHLQRSENDGACLPSQLLSEWHYSLVESVKINIFIYQDGLGQGKKKHQQCWMVNAWVKPSIYLSVCVEVPCFMIHWPSQAEVCSPHNLFWSIGVGPYWSKICP